MQMYYFQCTEIPCTEQTFKIQAYNVVKQSATKHLTHMIRIRPVAWKKQCVNLIEKSFIHIGKSEFDYKRLLPDFRQLIAHSRIDGVFT